MSAQNVFVVNCESVEGTQVVGVFLTEKLGRAAAKNYVEEYYEEGVMKGKKAKSESDRKVLYAEESAKGEKITITEIACEMPVAKGKKAKKDPNAPKKGLSAYMIFAKENRERIKTENPEADFGAMGKLIGNEWKALDEKVKETYKVKSEADKERYTTEVANYIPVEVKPKEKKVKVEKVKAEVEPKEEKTKAKKLVKKAVEEEVKAKKIKKVLPKVEVSEPETSDSEVEVEVKPKKAKA